jgi:thioredoxin 1
MAACCIGGVCIPYSAILPLVMVFLQYLIRPLMKLGLIPPWLAQKLGVDSKNEDNKKQEISSCGDSCGSKRRGKHDQKSSSSLTETTSESCSSRHSFDSQDDDASKVCTMKFIQTAKEFEMFMKESSILVVKFTAEWCKPCKAVQPVFQEIANKYHTRASNVNFAVVDVDELDEVAGAYKITMMPTFIAFKDGKHIDSMSGINSRKLETFIMDATGAST